MLDKSKHFWQEEMIDGPQGLLITGEVRDGAAVPLREWSPSGRSFGSGTSAEIIDFVEGVGGELLWLDSCSHVYRRNAFGLQTWTAPCPETLKSVSRMITWGRKLWVLDSSRQCLHCLDWRSLQELESITFNTLGGQLTNALKHNHKIEILDIAPDFQDGFWLLGLCSSPPQKAQAALVICRFNAMATLCRGSQITISVNNATLPPQASFAVVCAEKDAKSPEMRFALSYQDSNLTKILRIILKIYYRSGVYNRKRKTVYKWRRLPEITMPLCRSFNNRISSNGKSVFLIPDKASVTSPPAIVRFNGEQVIVNTDASRATFRSDDRAFYTSGNTIQEWVGHQVQRASSLKFLNLLSKSSSPDRAWSRVEILAHLPAGATLSIFAAASNDPAIDKEVRAIAMNKAHLPADRLYQIYKGLGLKWTHRATYKGDLADVVDQVGGHQRRKFVAPLHSHSEKHLYLYIEISGNHPKEEPQLFSVDVLKRPRSLMDDLPRIFRAPEPEGSAYLQDLVSVLDATSDDLGTVIGRLGSNIDPHTAPEDWLDYLGRWMGVPWHEQLPPAAKRRLLKRSSVLSRWRGTRRGLILLLKCLLPNAVVRVQDVNSSLRLAILAELPDGSPPRLPLVLMGSDAPGCRLGARGARLGQLKLSDDKAARDPVEHAQSRVWVDIWAYGQDLRSSGEFVKDFVTEFLPAGLVADIRWHDSDLHAGEVRLGRDRLIGELPNLSLNRGMRLGDGQLAGTFGRSAGLDEMGGECLLM